MRIAIIGAGISGLATAGALCRAGFDTHVFERDASVRAGGSGITLFANALTALDSLGYGEPIRTLQARQPSVLGGQRTRTGRLLAKLPADLASQSLAVSRPELHRILLSGVPESRVHTGHALTSASTTGELEFSTGSSSHPVRERFDVVIGADGIRSTVRAGIGLDPGTHFAGYSAWRGIAPSTVDLAGVAGESWGVRARFGYAPLADGGTYWFAVRSTEDSGEDPGRSARTADADPHAALEALFGDWHEPIPQLIAATPADGIGYLPITELADDLSVFYRGHCVLIGDAAHAMTPNMGQGAAQGLEDAATLVALLRHEFGHRDNRRTGSGEPATARITRTIAPAVHALPHVFAEYDALRRPRSQQIALQSRRIGQASHATGRATAPFRDAMMRLVPDSLIAQTVRDLAAWQPPRHD